MYCKFFIFLYFSFLLFHVKHFKVLMRSFGGGGGSVCMFPKGRTHSASYGDSMNLGSKFADAFCIEEKQKGSKSRFERTDVGGSEHIDFLLAFYQQTHT